MARARKRSITLTGSRGALHELSRAIGALEASVANLTKMVDEERVDAARHRQSLREVIASLTEAIRVFNVQQTSWKEEWEKRWRPLLEDYDRRKSESVGRAKLGSLLMAIWMMVAGSVVAVVTWLLNRTS